MSVETTELCLHQEDISNYIMSITKNPNYSFTHNQEAINIYRQEALNNTGAINNETSRIVDKIYNILLGSLKSSNHSTERKHNNSPSFSLVSMLRNHRSVSDNENVFRQFNNMQDESDSRNYYNEDDDSTDYSITNEDYGNMDTTASEYPNFDVSDADVSTLSTETLYHDLNTDEVGDKPNRDSIPPTHNQQDQQFEEEDTKISDMAGFTGTVISFTPSPAPQQTGSNFPTTEFNISVTTTSQNLLITNEDISATSIIKESTISVTAGLTSSTSIPLPNRETDTNSQTSKVGEGTTTGNESAFQQTNTSTESVTESQTTMSIQSSTESQITTQTQEGLIHVQIPDTVNLCVVKCYFSGSFLKKYLFILLFFCYFIPILASMVIYVATDKNLTTIQSLEVKSTEEPSTTEEKRANETACNMHLARMGSAPKMVKHFITTSTLLWTPTFVETLLRVWFCINTPEWLTTLLFVLSQANAIIRNALNLRLIRSHACSGTVQPLEVEQGKANIDIPTKLFTKVKAAFLQQNC
jgi:hypothetical protein